MGQFLSEEEAGRAAQAAIQARTMGKLQQHVGWILKRVAEINDIRRSVKKNNNKFVLFRIWPI